MSDSLRDQLLGLGFKPAPKPEKSPAERRPGAAGAKQGGAKQGGANVARGGARGAQRPEARRREEMDLAKAYAIRAQREKEERIAAERARQEEARQRREARARVVELLAGATLNDASAEVARHFEYGGKIRRVYVTPEQLRALNAGDLAVVQNAGRYHLVTAEVGRQAEAILAGVRALQVDPAAPASEDPYADPRFQVPDDLVW